MATEFNDAIHKGFFMVGDTLRNGNGFSLRQSELTLAALRSAGFLDNMVDGLAPPSIDKLWLDKNTDPSVLKEWNPIGFNWQKVTSQTLFGRLPFKGNWDDEPIYRPGDLVRYGGNIWIAVVGGQNHIPSDDAYWDIFIDGSDYATSDQGALAEFAYNKLQDQVWFANDYNAHPDDADISVKLQQMLNDLSGYSKKAGFISGGYWRTKDVIIPGSVNIYGDGRDATIFVPAVGSLPTTPLFKVTGPSVRVRGITVDTRGFSKPCLELTAFAEAIQLLECQWVGDLNGDMIRNEGDTTEFITNYFYPSSADTWAVAFLKDAQSAPPSTDPQGNNHSINGGNVGGGYPLANGHRIAQYNVGSLTEAQLKVRRVEGVSILGGHKIITDGVNIDIGNSLLVKVTGTILDQAAGIAVRVRDYADEFEIVENYIGSTDQPSRVGKKGVVIENNAGKGKVKGNTFYNLETAIEAKAVVSRAIPFLEIKDNQASFILGDCFKVDSVRQLEFGGNVDHNDLSGSRTGQSLATLTTAPAAEREYNIFGSRLPVTGAYDLTAKYKKNAGNYGQFDWTGRFSTRVRRIAGAGFSVANGGSPAAVTWVTHYSVADMFRTATSLSRLYVPPGASVVDINVNVTWANSSVGNRFLYLYKNGVDTGQRDLRTALFESPGKILIKGELATPGDYYEVFAFQDSGGAINLFGEFVLTVSQ